MILLMVRLLLTLYVLQFSVFAATPQPGSNWHLVWSDEFDGARNAPPDPAKWAYDLGDGGWGNRELEVYTKDPQNIFQDGHGHLVIRAIKTDAGEFTSARIKTQGNFAIQYGKIEARMKIPYGQGMWPAFWMLGQNIATVGWPKCGEIDVMENIGKEPSIVHGTVHGPGYSGKNAISSQYALPDSSPLSDDFHIYSAEWSPESVQFVSRWPRLRDGHASRPAKRNHLGLRPSLLPAAKSRGGWRLAWQS